MAPPDAALAGPGGALRREAGSLLLAAAMVVYHLLLVRGYRVYSGDQRQYFLQPFAEMSPDFIPRDWLTWQTSHYHAFFSWFVRGVDGLGWLLGLTFETAIFVAYVGVLWFAFRGILALVRALGGGHVEFLLTILLALGYGEQATRGPGESFLLPSGYLVPSGIAAAFAVYALALLLRKRFAPAFLCLGVAGMVHVNYGMAGLPIFAVFYAILRRGLGPVGDLLRCAVAFAVPFSITFVPTLLAFAGAEPAPGQVGLGDILRLAAPGHYVASTWPVAELLAAFLPLVGAAALLWRRPDQRTLGAVLAAAVVVFAAIYLAQLGGSLFVARLFFWRIFPCVQLVAFVVIARELRTVPRSAVVLAVLAAAYLGLSTLAPDGVLRPAATLVALAATAFAAAILPRLPFCALHPAALTATALVLCYPAMYLQRGYGLPRFEVRNPDPLCAWVRENTEPNALFLTPPMMGHMRVLGRRAVIVTAGQFPVGRPDEMAEWLRRLRETSGVEDLFGMAGGDNLGSRLARRYLERDPAAVKQTMREFDAAYFVTTEDHAGIDSFVADPELELLHRVDGRLVFARAF